MSNNRKAPTTDYWSEYREDWKPGGVYDNLTDCSLVVLMKLKAYADGEGCIRKPSGKEFPLAEIVEITNTSYKRLKVALTELRIKGIISDTINGIKITSYYHDNTRRKKNRDSRTLTEANGQTLAGRV